MKTISALLAATLSLVACSSGDAGTEEAEGNLGSSGAKACTFKAADLGMTRGNYASGCTKEELCAWDKPIAAGVRSEERVSQGICKSEAEVVAVARAFAEKHVAKYGLKVQAKHAGDVQYFGATDNASLRDMATYLKNSALRILFNEDHGGKAGRFFVAVYLKPDLSLEQAFIGTNFFQPNVSIEVDDSFQCLVAAWKCGANAEVADKACPRLAGAKPLACAQLPSN